MFWLIRQNMSRIVYEVQQITVGIEFTLVRNAIYPDHEWAKQYKKEFQKCKLISTHCYQ